MRFIDAEWLEKQAVCIYAYGGTRFVSVDTIKKAPTIEAEPVKHGRWEDGPFNGCLHCSVCKDVYRDDTWLDDGKWSYCPNCGAKMDLESEG